MAVLAIPATAWTLKRYDLIPGLWYFPVRPLANFLLACLVGLALVIAVRDWPRLRRALGRRPVTVSPGLSWRRLAVAATLLVAAGLLWRWQYNLVPGDGPWLIGDAHRFHILASEGMGRWIHFAFARALRIGGVADNGLAMALASLAAGLFYLGALIRLTPAVFPPVRARFVTLFLFLSPPSLVFACHLETTPWAYALAGTYFLMGLKRLRENAERPPWPESVVLALAIWVHGVICFATAAHLALCAAWLCRRVASSPTGHFRAAATMFGLLALPFAPLILTAAAAWFFGPGLDHLHWYGNIAGGGDGRAFVAFSKARASEVQLVFFEPEYLLQSVNLILQAFPLLPLMIPATLQLRRKRPREATFLLAAFAGLFLFSHVWNADLGMRRDFDLFLGFALPGQILIALWLIDRFPLPVSRRLLLLVAWSHFAFRLVPFLTFP